MKKKIARYIAVLVAAAVFSSCGSDPSKIPALDETFSQKDKRPFGAFVLHNQLEQFYYHNTILTINDNFEDTWRDISDTASLYINISKNLFLSNADLESMLAYVDEGNTLFLSSENIDQQLLDTLGCAVGESPSFSDEMKNTSVSMAPEFSTAPADFYYFFLPFDNHFTKIDKQRGRVLGSNKAGANFIVVFYGRGRFYLHTEPRALSNYFLLQRDNYQYCRGVFSFTPAIPEHIYWDDYYSKKNYASTESGGSGLQVLLKYPAMAWAFWLLLLLAALYILFGGKRRQRIVKTILPNTNTTVTFTETIGRLYLQKKDNRNIADKLIAYLFEYTRNQFYLNTSHINDEFVATLSRKSNNTQEGTQQLFDSITTIQQSMEVTDQQLLLLNQQIENFYKNKL